MATLETIAYYATFSILAAVGAWLGLDPWHGIASFGLWIGCRAFVMARRLQDAESATTSQHEAA